jgi:glycosyltransferase involved in cell wall biosynthesis
LPVLATSAAASGLDYKDNVDILIEDDIRKFSDAILKLFQSKDDLAVLKEGGLRRSGQYKWDVIGQQYVEKLALLVNEKKHG